MHESQQRFDFISATLACKASLKMAHADLRHSLKQYFGFSSFRGIQESAIQHVLRGNDALVLAPTGGGKSLCFQLPAMLLNGVTLVVSPLLALMQDQVLALKQKKIAAEMIGSSQTQSHNEQVLKQISASNSVIRLLYVTPEYLVSDSFQQVLDDLYRRKVHGIICTCLRCTTFTDWSNDRHVAHRVVCHR